MTLRRTQATKPKYQVNCPKYVYKILEPEKNGGKMFKKTPVYMQSDPHLCRKIRN
jgi:hypothetical protein